MHKGFLIVPFVHRVPDRLRTFHARKRSSFASSFAKIFTILAVVMIGSSLLVGTVYAHSRYQRSSPGTDAVLATPPARVDIWFEQELFRRKGDNTISVTGPDGKVVSAVDTEIDEDDRTHIWVLLESELPSGKYQVAWKNVSLEDGHSSEGSFVFTIDPQASVTSTPMAKQTQPSGKTASASSMLSQPMGTTVSSTKVSTRTPAPTTSPPVAGPCVAGIAPVLGLAGFVLVRRFQNKSKANET